jgi:hypothetical protein
MKINYRKFIEDNFVVIDKDTLVPIPFKLNKVQNKYYDILTEEYEEMEGVREIVLKARQEGMSSFILALFAVDFILRPYSVSICISHRKDATDLLFKKVKQYIDSYFHMLAKKYETSYQAVVRQFLKSDNRNLLENAQNNALFYIGTAGAKVGGREERLEIFFSRNVPFIRIRNKLQHRRWLSALHNKFLRAEE